LLGFLIVPPVRRSKARKYVLENKGAVAAKLAEADRTARSSDVKEETRKKLTKLKGEFSSIDRLTAASEGIKWIEVREKLDSMDHPLDQIVSEMKREMDHPLDQIVSEMKREITFAEKARKEGPELLKQIPGMIEAAEKKLAEGKLSSKAEKYIEIARIKYASVQSQQSEGGILNWVILYLLLNDSRSFLQDAQASTIVESNRIPSRHGSEADASTTNETRQHDPISDPPSSSDSSPSYGFGDSSGGFSGGGGFDSGGGGSSGSW